MLAQETLRESRVHIVTVCIILVGLDLAGCGPASPADRSVRNESNARLVKVGSGSLWRSATQKKMPSYPPPSLERGVGGVAVANVVVGVDGRVETIDVVEAPDELIAAAVREALPSWLFVPPRIVGSDASTRPMGKLVFYFLPEGAGSVRSAGEMRRELDALPGLEAPATDSLREISVEELAELIEANAWTVLDVRDRAEYRSEHHGSSVNIPFDEIGTRAILELSRSDGIVVGCAGISIDRCHSAARALSDLGFRKLAIHIPR